MNKTVSSQLGQLSLPSLRGRYAVNRVPAYMAGVGGARSLVSGGR